MTFLSSLASRSSPSPHTPTTLHHNVNQVSVYITEWEEKEGSEGKKGGDEGGEETVVEQETSEHGPAPQYTCYLNVIYWK